MTFIIDVVYFCFLPNCLTHHRCRWKHGRECVYGSAFSLDKVSVVAYRCCCCRRRRRRLRRQRFIVAEILLLTTNESTCTSVSNSYVRAPQKNVISQWRNEQQSSLSSCDGMPKHLKNFIIETKKEKRNIQIKIRSTQIESPFDGTICVRVTMSHI